MPSSSWKGVLAVSGFVIFWFNLLAFFSAEPPSEFSSSLISGQIIGALIALGPVWLFVLAYVRRSERRGSTRSAISSLGLNGSGIRKSLLWSVPFFGLIVVLTALVGTLAVELFGRGVFSFPYQSSLPLWYAVQTVVYSIFSSLTEEAVGVGYIVDRLMPAHPSSSGAATPAVLVRSTVAVLYHIGTYFVLFRFSLVTGIVELVLAFTGFTLIGYAYVRSKVRNISGPWAMHYVLDVVMVLETFRL